MMKACHWRYVRRRKCCVILLIIVVSLVMYVHYILGETRCSIEESVKVLQDLCREFHSDHVAGNLCPHLCDMHTMWFESCINYKGGKSVFKMRWMDEPVILKAKKARIGNYDSLDIPGFTLSSFMQLIAESVEMNLPVNRGDVGDDIMLKKLWMDNIEKYTDRKKVESGEDLFWKKGAVNSLWALVQQDEYLLLKYFDTFPYLPKLYGTCGHFYAVASMPPDSLLSIANFFEMTRLWQHAWKDRANLALKLLDLIYSFEKDFPQVLNMCDMKSENFGLSRRGDIAAIDVDMAVFSDKLKRDMSYPNCTQHEDCSFFDCQGWCDLSSHRCTDIRLNNNLQSLCRKIFTSREGNAFTGLLRSPPSNIPQLEATLAECTAPPPMTQQLPGCSTDGSIVQCPATEDKMLNYKADGKLLEKLQTLLKKSVEKL